MKILKNIIVPTGNIMIVSGEKGNLECLSIGDYGKEANLKADFMGLTREIKHVEHQAYNQCTYVNTGFNYFNNLVEEIADVQIMLW